MIAIIFMWSVFRLEIFDFAVFISTKNKTDCVSNPFLFLVRIFWMRNNVQVAS